MTRALRFAAALALVTRSEVVAQAPDHYLCYDAVPARIPGIVPPPSTLPQTRTLEDQFGSGTYDVTEHELLCTPASKNGEPVEHGDVHQVGYAIRRKKPRFGAENHTTIDQFGTRELRISKPTRLLVPSAKAIGPGGVRPVDTTGVDHFTCYRARPVGKHLPFVPVTVIVTDQFAERFPYLVKKPVALCAPTDKSGEDRSAPQHPGHLVCYQVARAKGFLSAPPSAVVSVANTNFGNAVLVVKDPALLCVPAEKDRDGSLLDFTTEPASGVCGQTADAAMTPIRDLACGLIVFGGGFSSYPPGFPIPEGSTHRFTAACSSTTCTLGATLAPTPDVECTGAGCAFGPPMPFFNGPESQCLQLVHTADASGSIDLASGDTTLDVALDARLVVTGDVTEPCPICRQGTLTGPPCAGSPGSPCVGVCEGGPAEGASCRSTNPLGLSRSCSIEPQPNSRFCYRGPKNQMTCMDDVDCAGTKCAVAAASGMPLTLAPTSASSDVVSGTGLFCPGQGSGFSVQGCFGNTTCRMIHEAGIPVGPLMPPGTKSPLVLAATGCTDTTSSLLVIVYSLPGPVAVSLTGTAVLVP